ncbi:hypothetical protein RHS03_03430, partial [Rhizoctonia solani]
MFTVGVGSSQVPIELRESRATIGKLTIIAIMTALHKHKCPQLTSSYALVFVATIELSSVQIKTIPQWPIAITFRPKKLMHRKGGGNVRNSRWYRLVGNIALGSLSIKATINEQNKQEKDAERLRDEAEFAAYQVAKATATEPLGPPPTTAAQRRAEESIEDLVARAEALERAQSRKGSARDTLMAALAKQKAEKAEWAKQKEQAATTDK